MSIFPLFTRKEKKESGSAGLFEGFHAEIESLLREKAITIHHVKKIVKCTSESVVVQCGKEYLVIEGSLLACKIFAGKSMRINGHIQSIAFQR